MTPAPTTPAPPPAAPGTPQDWLVSSSPHARAPDSVPRIMGTVLIALLPALAAAVTRFGWDAARLVFVCVAACIVGEALARRLMGRDVGVGDGSAVVTGVLLAFNLPPGVPNWMAAVGSLVAIVFAKQCYGGLGYNPFNPALVGRVFLLVAFPVAMTTWSPWAIPVPAGGVEAITTATPLGLAKTELALGRPLPFVFDAATALQFFLGARNGCLGETSGLALVLGGLYLLWRRVIRWQVPAAYLGTVLVFSAILWRLNPAGHYPPLFHLLSGGLLLGAFFMATDMVTTPLTPWGNALFGVGCGALTMIIRAWGGYPEGVSFAILIMNAFTPLLNRLTRPRIFGRGRRRPAAAGEAPR